MQGGPRSAAEHYEDAERLVASAEALVDVTEEAGPAIALLALTHAVLAHAPRRARKRPKPTARHTPSWLDDNKA